MTKKNKKFNSKRVADVNAVVEAVENTVIYDPIEEFTGDPSTPEPTVEIENRCTEWCFLPGLSHVGPYGLLQCLLAMDHDEEHVIKVEIYNAPKGRFTITWTRE